MLNGDHKEKPKWKWIRKIDLVQLDRLYLPVRSVVAQLQIHVRKLTWKVRYTSGLQKEGCYSQKIKSCSAKQVLSWQLEAKLQVLSGWMEAYKWIYCDLWYELILTEKPLSRGGRKSLLRATFFPVKRPSICNRRSLIRLNMVLLPWIPSNPLEANHPKITEDSSEKSVNATPLSVSSVVVEWEKNTRLPYD